MSDADKKKTQETWLIRKGSVSFNNDLLRRGVSRTRLSCRSDKIRNRAIFGRLRGMFYSTEINISYNASEIYFYLSAATQPSNDCYTWTHWLYLDML